MSISLLDKLKNKALYKVETLINDPEANRFAAEKAEREKEEKDKAEKEKQEKAKNISTSPPVKEALEQPEEPESSSAVVRIAKKTFGYIKRILEVAFFPFLSILFASFIANEMIIYPAPVRLCFFVFTLIICLLSRTVIVILSLFYLCKWGFHYYVNEMSDGPKRLIMPTLFAILPLTTNEYPNRFKNFFAKPFQYGERWSRRDARELDTRMEMYQTSLKEAFPFVEAIKTQEPYQEQLQKISKKFSELHQAMAPPAPPAPAPIVSPPLPAVITPVVPTAPPAPAPAS